MENKDKKFNKLMTHINLLAGYYRHRETSKAEIGSYSEANEALTKRSVLEDLMIEAEKICKSHKDETTSD